MQKDMQKGSCSTVGIWQCSVCHFAFAILAFGQVHCCWRCSWFWLYVLIWHLAFGIWHLAFGIWHFGIWHLAFWNFGIWHLAFWNFGIWHLAFWNLAFAVLLVWTYRCSRRCWAGWPPARRCPLGAKPPHSSRPAKVQIVAMKGKKLSKKTWNAQMRKCKTPNAQM